MQLARHGGEPVPQLSRAGNGQPHPHPPEPGQLHLDPLAEQLPHQLPGTAGVAMGLAGGDIALGTPARGRGGPLAMSPPRCGPDRGGCSHLDAPSPAKPPPRATPAGLRHLQDHVLATAALHWRSAARHGAGPGRQSLREELQRHRLLLHHPRQPPHHPGDPGARWVPGAPPGLRVFGLGVSPLSSPCPLPAEVPRKPPPMPTSPAPTLDTLPNDLLLMLRPWKCTDDTMEIIITRSHLEVRAPPACWGGPHPAPGARGMQGGPAGHPGGSCGHGWCFSLSPSRTW